MKNIASHNQIQSRHVKVYLLLGLATSIYAALLNTEHGKRITEEETWFTVSLGTAIVLAFCRFILPTALWNKVLLAFFVGGSPLIFRSLQNKI